MNPSRTAVPRPCPSWPGGALPARCDALRRRVDPPPEPVLPRRRYGRIWRTVTERVRYVMCWDRSRQPRGRGRRLRRPGE
ncbi:hypothetical protein SSAG_03724 [Streptomyces sp. Mg1]|nr:hypothetical protein SSAG_03724 [Streptomyces sp. Mg1]